jgi:hypothetical protein
MSGSGIIYGDLDKNRIGDGHGLTDGSDEVYPERVVESMADRDIPHAQTRRPSEVSG